MLFFLNVRITFKIQCSKILYLNLSNQSDIINEKFEIWSRLQNKPIAHCGNIAFCISFGMDWKILDIWDSTWTNCEYAFKDSIQQNTLAENQNRFIEQLKNNPKIHKKTPRMEFFFNSLNAKVSIILKPVNWITKKINWLVSIWWQICHLMS